MHPPLFSVKPSRMGALQAITSHMTLGPAEKGEIIDAYYQHLSLPKACEATGHSLRAVMETADEDEEFRAALNKAESHLAVLAEDEAKRRAIYGVDELVVANGKVVYVVEDGVRKPLKQRKYSDGLLQFYLKGRRRDVFGDKVEIEQTHKGHIALPVLSPEDFNRYLAEARGETFDGPTVIEGEVISPAAEVAYRIMAPSVPAAKEDLLNDPSATDEDFEII